MIKTIKYFTSGNATKYENIIVVVHLLIISILSILSIVILLHDKPNPQPAIIGGLSRIPHEYVIKDNFFDTAYAGDTACFELVNDSAITLRCVCPCTTYKKNLKEN